ncbi:CU044_5270 family protein [Streptantibioticus silvisoli]|uniref:CU044_5270 family protein n=1 Tax=Streptantibioticus silvisoli TaxID=2705255 RepID=A0ABT6WB36_9ACTN|nr:CU044_5270 family protein [Streptantibioticus silvisoli]MDI5967709.1 CU044_5270 family protein [Streptantibioticus silvisoli]
MNDTTASSPGPYPAEVRELALLLPPPAERDLPPGRHLHHKDVLMRRVDHDTTPAPPSRRRLLRPAVLAPVTALALAGALAVSLHPGGHGAARETAHGAAGTRQATVLLGRISDVALATDAVPVGDSQFVYVRSEVRGADETSGKAVTGPLTEREVWLSQVPGPVRRLGLIRQDGATEPINPELGDTHGTAAGLDRPTYRWLASLPTDPGALLRYLYARTPAAYGLERDQAVFDQIGDLISEQVMPPANAAALYRAAARIPGVTAAPRATDALGRHGVGIARDDSAHGERSEWVFDARDLSFLGSRTYLTEDSTLGRAGTLLSSDAVQQRAVVDRAGERPAPARPSAAPSTTARPRG